MGTKAIVGVETEGGRVFGNHCNWDGYPEHLGAFLLKHCSSKEEALRLVDGKSIRSVDFTEPFIERYEIDALGGELFISLDEFQNQQTWFDWVYLFRGGEWLCKRSNARDWRSILSVLAETENE